MAVPAGNVYGTEEELAVAVAKLIFPNSKKGITGVNHQQAVLDMVASLWRSAGGSLQNLQSVLDTGAIATAVTAPVSIGIAGNTTFELAEASQSFNFLDTGVTVTLSMKPSGFSFVSVPDPDEPQLNTVKAQSSVVELSALGGTDDTPTVASLSIDPQRIQLNASDGSGVTVKIEAKPTGIDLYSNASGGGENTINLSGDEMLFKAKRSAYTKGLTIRSLNNQDTFHGLMITDNYATPPDPTARLDVDGTARIRELGDGSADANMLTVDDDGNVHETARPGSAGTLHSNALSIGVPLEPTNITVEFTSDSDRDVHFNHVFNGAALGDWSVYYQENSTFARNLTITVNGVEAEGSPITRGETLILKCIKRLATSTGGDHEYVFVTVNSNKGVVREYSNQFAMVYGSDNDIYNYTGATSINCVVEQGSLSVGSKAQFMQFDSGTVGIVAGTNVTIFPNQKATALGAPLTLTRLNDDSLGATGEVYYLD
jgi:hypothetical protein